MEVFRAAIDAQQRQIESTPRKPAVDARLAPLDILNMIRDVALGGIAMSRSATFVASWSENGNLLSQWRAYCPQGGYALGVHAGALESAARSQGFELVPCIYKADEQLAIARAFVAHVVARIQEAEIEEMRNPHQGSQLGSKGYQAVAHYIRSDYFGWIAPVFKHEGFGEEREWRLIARYNPYNINSVEKHRLHVQAGSDKLKRYLRFRLKGEADNVAFRTTQDRLCINLGPGLDDEWEADTVRYLVRSMVGPIDGWMAEQGRSQLRPVYLEVNPSGIPFRRPTG